MKCIIAKKIEMSQIFDDKGTVTPVTLLKVEPTFIAALKKGPEFSYSAVVLASGKSSSCPATRRGQMKHLKECPSPQHVKEFRCEEKELEGFEVGTKLEADTFETGDRVKVTARSKGKGFQGVVKRHKFAGAEATHGHKHDLRKPGSIGCAYPQHVIKGRRMAGRMGYDQVTLSTSIVAFDLEQSVIAVKGSIPGARHTMVTLMSR